MSVTADRKNYEAPLILIHWPLALLIFGLYAVGLSIDVFDKPLCARRSSISTPSSAPARSTRQHYRTHETVIS
jgi:hypothetical protein